MSAKVGYLRESDNLADAIEVKSEELRVKSKEMRVVMEYKNNLNSSFFLLHFQSKYDKFAVHIRQDYRKAI